MTGFRESSAVASAAPGRELLTRTSAILGVRVAVVAVMIEATVAAGVTAEIAIVIESPEITTEAAAGIVMMTAVIATAAAAATVMMTAVIATAAAAATVMMTAVIATAAAAATVMMTAVIATDPREAEMIVGLTGRVPVPVSRV